MATRSVNKVILLGNLGKDAETKFTTGGAARTTFSVATSRRWKDQATGEWKEETDWHLIVLWRMENVATYLTKGQRVYLEGRLQTHSYDDKDGKKVYRTEVIADELLLLGGRGEGAASEDSQSQVVSRPRKADRPAGPSAEEPPAEFGVTDDDVPF
jgi:single-strand DNA-binding protein